MKTVDWYQEYRSEKQKYELLYATIMAHAKTSAKIDWYEMLEEFWAALEAWEASQ